MRCCSVLGGGYGGLLRCPASYSGAQAGQEETQEGQERGEGEDQR